MDLAKRSAALYPDWDSTYWVLIAACGQLDRPTEARARATLSLSPGMTLSGARQRLPIRAPPRWR
jgi:hypothetical protein